jgi:hypothetical protein
MGLCRPGLTVATNRDAVRVHVLPLMVGYVRRCSDSCKVPVPCKHKVHFTDSTIQPDIVIRGRLGRVSRVVVRSSKVRSHGMVSTCTGTLQLVSTVARLKEVETADERSVA